MAYIISFLSQSDSGDRRIISIGGDNLSFRSYISFLIWFAFALLLCNIEKHVKFTAPHHDWSLCINCHQAQMSYAFLFKVTQPSFFFKLSHNTNRKMQSGQIGMRTESEIWLIFVRSFVFSCALSVYYYRRHWCWKVVPAASVHRQAVPTCAWLNNRSRIWCSDDHNRETTNQTSDLGHCKFLKF